MILNDALYLISASRRGGKFNQILIRKDDGTCVDLDGNDLDGLIEKNVYETKELLNNEIIDYYSLHRPLHPYYNLIQ